MTRVPHTQFLKNQFLLELFFLDYNRFNCYLIFPQYLKIIVLNYRVNFVNKISAFKASVDYAPPTLATCWRLEGSTTYQQRAGTRSCERVLSVMLAGTRK